MNQTVSPGPRTGSVRIPASKSQAHRLLICAALGAQPVALRCDGVSADIAATARCLSALGADITDDGAGTLRIVPIAGEMPAHADLFCGESGSTLRFLLPLVGALGKKAVFNMEGRLPERPLAPFDDELRMHGMEIRREGGLLYCSGKLKAGKYTLPGAQLTERHARALLRLSGEAEQLAALAVIVGRSLNVAQTESYIERLLAQAQVTPPQSRPTYIIKDVRLFLNSIDRSLQMIRQCGVDADLGRRDTDSEILLTIRIPKQRAVRPS